MRTKSITTLLTLAALLGGCASGKQVLGGPGTQADGATLEDSGVVYQDEAIPFSASEDGAAPQSTPTGPVPRVVITEFMANPVAVLDSTGEWFELQNLDSKPVDLQGWTIKDDKSNTHTIKGSVPMAPGGYLVLGKTKDLKLNGGAKVHYAYGTSWYLNNGSDQITLFDAHMRPVDRVAYDSGAWTVPVGASLSRKNPQGPAGASAWCQETGSWGGSSGDKGSPGAAAKCGP